MARDFNERQREHFEEMELQYLSQNLRSKFTQQGTHIRLSYRPATQFSSFFDQCRYNGKLLSGDVVNNAKKAVSRRQRAHKQRQMTGSALDATLDAALDEALAAIQSPPDELFWVFDEHFNRLAKAVVKTSCTICFFVAPALVCVLCEAGTRLNDCRINNPALNDPILRANPPPS